MNERKGGGPREKKKSSKKKGTFLTKPEKAGTRRWSVMTMILKRENRGDRPKDDVTLRGL